MAELTKEATGLRDINRKEAEERQMIIRSIQKIQSRVKADIALSDQAMASFKGFREAHLDREGNLVLVDMSRKTISKPLASLSGDEFVSVARDCAPELLQLVGKEENEIIESKRPELLLRISLEGGRLLIFDWRSYHVSIRNVGGDSKDLRVSAKIQALFHRYDPLELRHDAEAQLDLRKFHNLARQAAVKVDVRCKDVDRREYGGSLSLELEDDGWKNLPLQAIGLASAL